MRDTGLVGSPKFVFTLSALLLHYSHIYFIDGLSPQWQARGRPGSYCSQVCRARSWKGLGEKTTYVPFLINPKILCSWHGCVPTDKVIPRQLFEVPIQAAVGKRIIARETLSAMRADVTAGLYGGISRFCGSFPDGVLTLSCLGHYERKLKHLNNQKEGKRRMKKIGSVELPQEAFFDILRTKS